MEADTPIEEIIFYDYVYGIGTAITELTFCESHWIFACYYYRVATQNPIIIKMNQVPLNKIRSFNIMYWTGIVANAFFPITEGVFITWLTNKID